MKWLIQNDKDGEEVGNREQSTEGPILITYQHQKENSL